MTEQATTEVRRRVWPVRFVAWLTRPFREALWQATADPPPLPVAWRHPARLQHLSRYLPVSRIDIVVVAEAILAFIIYVASHTVLLDVNDQLGQFRQNSEVLFLAAAGAALPLLLRQLWPLAAWRVALPAMGLNVIVAKDLSATFDNPYPAGAVIVYLLVLYSVGVRCARRTSLGVWLISVLGMVVLHPSPSVFLGAIMTGAALLFGYNVRVRRQAQRRVVEEERRTEEERAARAVLEERSRIARELHDVVAHHMSVIAIQAEAAPIKAPHDAEVLKRELVEIRGTALEALTEMRRILGVLRQGDQAPVTAPQPGLDNIEELLANSRAAGQSVTLTTTGAVPPTTPGVGLAAYRILQESLSNALRHAPGASVRVDLDCRDGAIRLRVENDPPPRRPPRSPGGGHGLTGMRERVGTVGGTLSIGPTSAGGFVVAATLPLPATGETQ